MPEGHPQQVVDQTSDPAEWLRAVERLVTEISVWAAGLDWSCRQIMVKVLDSRYGEYQAPGLMMQKDAAKLRLEPVSGNVIGADGVVDLYILPAYDDLASIYLKDGRWQLNYLWRDAKHASGQFSLRDVPSEPLTRDSFTKVVEEMARYAGTA